MMDANIGIVGTIRCVNAKGVRLENEDGWRNYSRFAKAEDLNPPAVGCQVCLTVDKQNFIRTIGPLAVPSNGRKPVVASQGPVAPLQAPTAALEPSPTGRQSVKPSSQGDKAANLLPRGEDVPDWPPPWEGDAEQMPGTQRIISRQAVLNTATAILSSGGRATEAKEVVALATQLERWVHRTVKEG